MRTILQNYSKSLLWVFGLLFYATVFAQTPFTATYTFGPDGNVASFDYNGTAYAGLQMGPALKVGINSSSSTNNFRGTNWPLGATSGSDVFSGSLDSGKYIQFSVANVPGYKYTVTSINFGVGRSGTGTRQSQWRGSHNAFGAALDNYTTLATGLTNSGGVLTNADANITLLGNVLDVSSLYSDQTGTSTFRFYLYNSEAAAGTAGLQGALTVSGTFELIPLDAPSIVSSATTLTDFGTTEIGASSASQSFTVTGSNLTEGVTVTAPANFEVSQDNSAFSGSFVLSQSGGTLTGEPVTIYVRFSPTSVGTLTGSVTLASAGAITQSVAVAGTGELASLSPPVAVPGTVVGPASFQANWESVEGATSYRLDVSLSPTFEAVITASDLLISEYVEGVGNNKYIEVFNGTGATVDLNGYALVLYVNGETSANTIQALSGSLANGATLVYRNSQADLAGTEGFPSSPLCNFNGDDAIVLFNTNTNSIVDVFGSIGTDPSVEWNVGGIVTQNQTLVRKATVSSGLTTNPPGSFPTLGTEWNPFPQNTVANLGVHTFNASAPSFVIGYENLTVNGLSQEVTGLESETTYYYRVRAFNGNTSLNSSVIAVTTAQEIPVTQVVASQCDGTLSELYGRINVNSVPGATMYRYRVARSTAPTTYEFFESPYPRFRLNNFTTLEINFGLTYLVAVQTAKVINGNTFWSEYGTECSITTPSTSTVVVSSNQCGQTLPTIASRIFFNSVPNANLYRYRVALQSNPAIVEEIETVFTSFRLNNLTTVPLTSETNYLVSIQARIVIDGNEVWTDYGTPCVIRTPDFPTTFIQASQCGDEDGAYAVLSMTEKLFCDFLSGASYRFKIEKYDNNVLIYSQTVTNSINWITLSSFTGLQPGETYNISVAYNYYGEGPFNKVCTLTVPALNLKPSDSYENSVSKLPNEFKAIAYPNPFRDSFALNVTTGSQSTVQLAVFDMTGRLLDIRTVALSALESLAIGENYPAGVYNVVISQDDEMQTIRVIKQ